MTISEALVWAKKVLKEKKVDGPEASAEFLLRQIIHGDKTYLFAHPEHQLTLAQAAKYRLWVGQRAKHKPVWYITSKIEFMGLDLAVNQDVLIPRPETELLIEKVLEQIPNHKSQITNKFKIQSSKFKVLEVGTGSGAIILSLVTSLRGASDSAISFSASDISPKALAVAKKNAKSLGLDERVIFRQGDLFAPWQGQKFDLIVANLPYVPHEDMATLALDLIHYEPRIALDGGREGLEVYERFFRDLSAHLNSGAKAFCEIGYDQGDKIKRILAEVLPKAKVTVLGDYADIDRIVIIET